MFTSTDPYAQYSFLQAVFWPLVLLILAVGGFFLLILHRRYIFGLLVKRAKDLVMLEVRVPKEIAKKEEESFKDFKQIIGISEQMFASLASLYQSEAKRVFQGQEALSFEIVAKEGEILFYVGCPKELAELVEKQIHSFFPNAQIEPSQDFRVFSPEKKIAMGELVTGKRFIFPIKTYQYLGVDPLASVTNVFSKLGEGNRAALQILIQPTSNFWRVAVESAIRNLQSGRSISFSSSRWARTFQNIFHFGAEAVRAPSKSPAEQIKSNSVTPIQEEQIKLLQEKSGKTAFQAVLRIISLSNNEKEAQVNLQNIFSSFAQFARPNFNSFALKKPTNKGRFLTNFILREPRGGKRNLLTVEELASLYHFPSGLIETPGVRWHLSKKASAPAELPKEGIILGENIYRGEKNLVRIQPDDRRRHLYAIGMTGTGKTTFFESMILQDVREGRGVAFFDPHGEAAENILTKIPKERAEDVVYFDPGDTLRPFGLNLLEWEKPEERDFLVQETIQIFYKLFDPTHQGFIGPQFEHWLRNAALTLMASPEGGTLIEIPRLFTDDHFREEKIQEVKDQVVKAFWTQQMAKTADFHKSEMYNYFISKFGRFMTNEMMRNIMGQPKSSFDLKQIMDEGKILIVNLSKGKIGELNSFLLGMILATKLFTAAIARHGVAEEKRKDFYLYIDEFQNFTTETFVAILSEARKYRLNLNITNQFIAQIPEDIRDAIIGNVGTLISFRIGAADAEFMAKEFTPVFDQEDLINIERFNAVVKLLVSNTPTKPFSMRTVKDPTVPNQKLGEAIRELSRLKYGKDLAIVEEEILNRTKISETKI